MEKYFLEVVKLVNELGDNQDKVFGEIEYVANGDKELKVTRRDKKTFKYLERCQIYVENNDEKSWNNIVNMIKYYVIGGYKND